MKGGKGKRRLTIGVLAGWQAYAGAPDSFLHQLFHGIQAAAQAYDCNLLIAYGLGSPRDITLGRPAWPLVVPEADFVPVGSWNTDGLIIAPPIAPSEEMEAFFRRLQGEGYPLVFAGSGEQGPSVVPDNESGMQQVLEHLLSHSHRQIAFIAGHQDRPQGDSGHRLRAYLRFMHAHGLATDPDLTAYSAHTTEGGYRAMHRILQTHHPFTAVMASNDLAAVGAAQALHEAGLSIPDDVALAGFDDRIEARASIPRLTTVHYPVFELGYQSVILLLRYLSGEAQGIETIRVPTHLVVRESCGCLPSERVADQLSSLVGNEPHVWDEAQLIEALVTVTSEEIQRLSQKALHGLCAELVQGFHTSLTERDPAIFQRTFQRILNYTAAHDDNEHAWHAALTVLRQSHLSGPGTLLNAAEVAQMLDRARIAISAIAQGHHARQVAQEAEFRYQLNQLTARLHTAQDEEEVFQALVDHLPIAGIRHVAVGLYEPAYDDPVAWCTLRAAPGEAHILSPRFATRTFPPPGLYPEDQPYHLAVAPLVTDRGLEGFIAFDMGNLDLCADIVLQIVPALRGARLYQAAVEGQRLAEEANRLKSRFLSMVSHELRTPLNLISGLTDLLLRQARGEGTQTVLANFEDLEQIYVNAQHLDALIRDVLDLSVSEIGELRLVREPLDLWADVIEPVAVIGHRMAQDKGLSWRTAIPQDLPSVYGDRVRLRQVLLNLVSNAVKFTTQGSITLSVQQTGGALTVSVTDTGLGVPREEQSVIFDEFRQSERTTSRGYGGLGLGLAICRRLVELHGGEIGVVSPGAVGEGARFFFTLPVPPSPPQVTSQPSGEGPRVLLISQTPERHQVLVDYLTEQGIELLVTRPRGDPSWLPDISSGVPDAIVLDEEAISAQGWGLLSWVKQLTQVQGVPVLFFRLSEADDRGAVFEASHLTKPVNADTLAQVLRSHGLLQSLDEDQVPKRILIVDDEPAVLSIHARLVKAQLPDCQILTARNGLEALQVIRTELPDLVLLDLLMPELDGFGVIEAMQAHELSRQIPVVVLTGQTLSEADIARLNRGTVGVLSKGIYTVQETLHHIAAALAHTREPADEARRAALRAMAYIQAHYDEEISRADIAAHVGLSERHLNRCFRRETGLTPVSYLNRYRIRQAKALLQTRNMTVTEVATSVGFASSGYFARVFRRETGMSPREYQRLGRNA